MPMKEKNHPASIAEPARLPSPGMITIIETPKKVSTPETRMEFMTFPRSEHSPVYFFQCCKAGGKRPETMSDISCASTFSVRITPMVLRA